MSGYSRTAFGQAWTDDTGDFDGHNGCDTRNDILRRDLHPAVIAAGTNGCVVASGTLDDPYTGAVIPFVRGAASSAVQIDHVVALGDAWTTGAMQLSTSARTALANDPLELLAVSGLANDSKGDADAADWVPPNRAEDCSYVARQIAVKARYRLWITPPERSGMERVLSGCPSVRLPVGVATALGSSKAAAPKVPVTAAATTRAPMTPRASAPPPATPPARRAVYVHPGSFCSPPGAHGVTDDATPMVCSTTVASPTQARWHHA